MNKILFIIFFTTTFCFSQNEKKTLEYLENIFCNRPFSTHGKISGNDFKLNIKSNKNKFYLEYIKGDYKQKVICNEKIILKFDYNHEELEIYSLTQKEKQECFFVSKFIKEIENIHQSDTGFGNKLIEASFKKINLKIGLFLSLDFQENRPEIEGKHIHLDYSIIPQGEKSYNDQIVFYEVSEFDEKFKDIFKKENFNIKLIKEKLNDWEIIDFR